MASSATSLHSFFSPFSSMNSAHLRKNAAPPSAENLYTSMDAPSASDWGICLEMWVILPSTSMTFMDSSR